MKSGGAEETLMTKASALKLSAIESLRTAVEKLEKSVAERVAWLQKPETAPVFSHRYTSRSVPSAERLDGKVSRKLTEIDEAITHCRMSPGQRAMIQAILSKRLADMHAAEVRITEEFELCMATNPIYRGMAEKDVERARKDLQAAIRSEQLHIISRSEEEIIGVKRLGSGHLLSSDKTRSARSADCVSSLSLDVILHSSVRLEEYRKRNIEAYAAAKETCARDVTEEMAGFEAQAARVKRTPARLSQMRKEAQADADRHADIALKQFLRVITREMRMLVAEECEDWCVRNCKPMLASLISQLPPSTTLESEDLPPRVEVLDVIDSNFEQCEGDWSLFASISRSYFGMLAGMELAEKDRLVRLYAVSQIVEAKQRELPSSLAKDNQDVQISDLRAKREELLRDVLRLDGVIKQKVAAMKREATAASEKPKTRRHRPSKQTLAHLQNYAALCSAAPIPSVPPQAHLSAPLSTSRRGDQFHRRTVIDTDS